MAKKFTKVIKRKTMAASPRKSVEKSDEDDISDLVDPPEEEQVYLDVSEGIDEIEPCIFYTPKKKIYHVEIPNGGASISAGNHATLEAARAALAQAKAELNL